MLRNAETDDSEDHFSSKTLQACRLVRIMTHNNTECDRTRDPLRHCTESYHYSVTRTGWRRWKASGQSLLPQSF